MGILYFKPVVVAYKHGILTSAPTFLSSHPHTNYSALSWLQQLGVWGSNVNGFNKLILVQFPVCERH